MNNYIKLPHSTYKTSAFRIPHSAFFSCLLLLASIFYLLSSPVYASVSDTWANVPKKLSGEFSGAWSDTDMSGPGSDGKDTVILYLIPGSTFKYKFKADPDSDGNFSFESDFSTASGNRELTVVDDGSGSMTIDANWSDTPGAGTNLRALADSGAVILSWDTPSGDSALDVAYGGWYNIYFDTGQAGPNWEKANSDTVTDVKYTVKNLKNDTTYYFYIQSVDAYGLASDSSEIDSATPEPKVNIIFRIFVGEMNDSEVKIGMDTDSWNEYSLKQEGTSGYWSETFVLYAKQEFSYKFIIIDTGGTKTYEYPVSNSRYNMFIYPDSGSFSQVQVQGGWNSWGDKTDLTLDADGYWRGEISLSAGQYEYKFITNGSNYVLDPYNSYTQNGNSLLAIDAMPTSSYMRELTVPLSDTTYNFDWEDTPPTPVYFRANPYTYSTVKLTWNKLSSTEDIDSYIIEYTETPSDTETWIPLAEVDSNLDYYIHTNLIIGDTYYYRISAKDYAGNISPYKNFDSATPYPQVEIWFKVELDTVSGIELLKLLKNHFYGLKD